MSTFAQTVNATPFGFFDSDQDFQNEADAIVTYVKLKMGEPILSVEITKKEVWACFEEASLEYGKLIHEFRMRNELINVLGLPTSSVLTNIYPRRTLEYMVRQAEPYASFAGIGGAFDTTMGAIDLVAGKQDYDLYSDLKVFSGTYAGVPVMDIIPTGSRGKLRMIEVFHVEPFAAQQMLLNASNITNFLATNFNYESYVNSSVFYVLPVFEDVLRRGMLESAFRIRRSNYNYQIIGSNLRIYPIPTNLSFTTLKLFIRVAAGQQNPFITGSSGVGFRDDSLTGISGPNNVPFGNLPFNSITQPGRQWIRQYTLALCREIIGLIRSKFDHVPVPNAEVRLNGESLVTQAREDKDKLVTQMKEFLADLTHDKMIEREAAIGENLQKQLRYVPFPMGKAIVVG